MPICLSNTLNLRCIGLTRNQSFTLIVPTALEFVVCTVPLTLRTKSAHSDWLLVLEGWSFLLISILDIANHILSPPANKNIDIAVGAISFIPLISLALFLFFLTRPYALPLHQLRSSVRESTRTAISGIMISFVPLLAVFNEASSFVGIHLVTLTPSGDPFFAFPSPDVLEISLSLSLISLSLLFAYLVISSGFHISNMTQSNQHASIRRFTVVADSLIPTRSNSSGKRMNRRAFWLVLFGFLFLSFEAFVGLVVSTSISNDPSLVEDQFDFGRILTRRILKAFGKGFLVIGVLTRNIPRQQYQKYSRHHVETSLSTQVSASTDTEALESARQRGAGRLSNILSTHVYDSRVREPRTPADDDATRNGRNKPRGNRNSFSRPFLLSSTGSSPPFSSYFPRARSGSGSGIRPGTWLRGNRRQGRERESEKKKRLQQRVTVEYTRPGAAPMLRFKKFSVLSWGELDQVALTTLQSSERRARTRSLPLEIKNGNRNVVFSRPLIRPFASTNGGSENSPSDGTIEDLRILIPKFPRTPDRALINESDGPGSGPSEGSMSAGAGFVRTPSGRRKPVPRLSKLITEESIKEDVTTTIANPKNSYKSLRIVPPPTSYHEPKPTTRRSIRDSLTLAFGNRVKRLSSSLSPKSPHSRSNSQAQGYELSSSQYVSPKFEPALDPDPFRKNSPPPVPPVPSIRSALFERLSEPPPLSPSTLNKDSPLSATAYSASRTVSMIGSAAAESPFISSPLPLQASSSRRPERGRPQHSERQARSPVQLRNQFRPSDLTLLPSRMFTSRLSASSYVSVLSPLTSPPPPAATVARMAYPSSSMEPFPARSPSDSPLRGRERPIVGTQTLMQIPKPRLATISGVVHQTPRPSGQRILEKSITAIPVPVMRLRSEEAAIALASTSERGGGEYNNGGEESVAIAR